MNNNVVVLNMTRVIQQVEEFFLQLNLH